MQLEKNHESQSYSPLGRSCGSATGVRFRSRSAGDGRIRKHERPNLGGATVALIEGICVGGGLEIAALCDLRICGESSRFGVPIKRLGLVMAYAEIEGLLSLVGRAAALEILLEGRVFGAREAKDKGLVTRVVADAEVAREAMATAGRIAEGAPLVARWHKQFLRRLDDPAPLTQAELDEGFACFDTEDFQIGTRSFLDKTKPAFKGR